MGYAAVQLKDVTIGCRAIASGTLYLSISFVLQCKRVATQELAMTGQRPV